MTDNSMNWFWCDKTGFGLILRYGTLGGCPAVGFRVANLESWQSPLFSERYGGYVGQFRIGRWLFRTFWPSRALRNGTASVHKSLRGSQYV